MSSLNEDDDDEVKLLPGDDDEVTLLPGDDDVVHSEGSCDCKDSSPFICYDTELSDTGHTVLGLQMAFNKLLSYTESSDTAYSVIKPMESRADSMSPAIADTHCCSFISFGEEDDSEGSGDRNGISRFICKNDPGDSSPANSGDGSFVGSEVSEGSSK